jgi:predicted transcriptional regulator of viral defense system
VSSEVKMEVNQFFAKHAVFTHDEFVDFLKSNGSCNIRTQDTLLAYHVKARHVLRIKRGLYAVVPARASAESYSVDPYLVSAKITPDAVLAYHTALEFYGRAYSVFEHFHYLTNTRSRLLSFHQYHFHPVRFPKALRDKKREHYGVRTEDRAGLDVKVTSLERILVDVLDRPDLAGGWEEIWRSLESVEYFDLDRVVEYTLLLDNATTAAKVGFFLEQHQQALMVNEVHLKALQKQKPEKPVYLSRSNRKSGRLLANWNLIVPQQILEQSWQEV